MPFAEQSESFGYELKLLLAEKEALQLQHDYKDEIARSKNYAGTLLIRGFFQKERSVALLKPSQV